MFIEKLVAFRKTMSDQCFLDDSLYRESLLARLEGVKVVGGGVAVASSMVGGGGGVGSLRGEGSLDVA